MGYSQHDDSDPLAHDNRATIVEAVDDSPGAHVTAVSNRSGIPLSTVRYHLRILEREGHVTTVRDRGCRRVYPATTEPAAIDLAAALRNEATARIIDTLARRGELSGDALAAALDRDASTVTHHLQALAADGIVVRERDGQTIDNRLSPAACEKLAPVVGAGDTGRRPPEGEAEAEAEAEAELIGVAPRSARRESDW